MTESGTSLAGTPPAPARLRATVLYGGGAVATWAASASLVSWTDSVPALQLLATVLAIGFLATWAPLALRGKPALSLTLANPQALLRGVFGNAFYNIFYVSAFKLTAPVEANLINYLWPLFSVMIAILFTGERVGRQHWAGLLLGLAGTHLLLTRGDPSALVPPDLNLGHLSALIAALSWGIYSVWGRRLGSVPIEAYPGWLLASALVVTALHFLFEPTVVPDLDEAVTLVLIGVGPVGAGILLWELGLRHGDFRVLNALAYAVPLLSTLLLIMLGLDHGNWSVWVACALVVGGAVIASR